MSWKSKSSVRTTNLGIEDVRVPAAVNYDQAIYKRHVRNLKCHGFSARRFVGHTEF